MNLIQEVVKAGEFAVSFLSNPENNCWLEKLPEDVMKKSKLFSESAADAEDGRRDFFSPETITLITTPESEVLLGFDIESENTIFKSDSTLKDDAEKALERLKSNFNGEADLDGNSI